VTEKHDAAHDTRGRHPENGLGLHYSRFSPISTERLLFPQLLAGSKIENLAANRSSQASLGMLFFIPQIIKSLGNSSNMDVG
jgi:hypothetical protein